MNDTGEIYSVDYTVRKGKSKETIQIRGVIVTIENVNDLLPLKKNEFYLCRALNLIDVKKAEVESYEVVDIKIIKKVKGL
jgi:hypothetical protein